MSLLGWLWGESPEGQAEASADDMSRTHGTGASTVLLPMPVPATPAPASIGVHQNDGSAREIRKSRAAEYIQQKQRAKGAALLHHAGVVDQIAQHYKVDKTAETISGGPTGKTQADWDVLADEVLSAQGEAELYRLGWQTLCRLPGLADLPGAAAALASLPVRLRDESADLVARDLVTDDGASRMVQPGVAALLAKLADGHMLSSEELSLLEAAESADGDETEDPLATAQPTGGVAATSVATGERRETRAEPAAGRTAGSAGEQAAKQAPSKASKGARPVASAKAAGKMAQVKPRAAGEAQAAAAPAARTAVVEPKPSEGGFGAAAKLPRNDKAGGGKGSVKASGKDARPEAAKVKGSRFKNGKAGLKAEVEARAAPAAPTAPVAPVAVPTSLGERLPIDGSRASADVTAAAEAAATAVASGRARAEVDVGGRATPPPPLDEVALLAKLAEGHMLTASEMAFLEACDGGVDEVDEEEEALPPPRPPPSTSAPPPSPPPPPPLPAEPPLSAPPPPEPSATHAKPTKPEAPKPAAKGKQSKGGAGSASKAAASKPPPAAKAAAATKPTASTKAEGGGKGGAKPSAGKASKASAKAGAKAAPADEATAAQVEETVLLAVLAREIAICEAADERLRGELWHAQATLRSMYTTIGERLMAGPLTGIGR